jgi:hypothetical protein
LNGQVQPGAAGIGVTARSSPRLVGEAGAHQDLRRFRQRDHAETERSRSLTGRSKKSAERR